MDLEKLWGEMNKETGSEEHIPVELPLKSSKSVHPIAKVRRSLGVTNFWGLLISAGYIALMIRFPFWPLLVGFSIVLLFNGVFIYQGIRLRNQLPSSVDPSHSMLSEMKTQYAAIKRWMDNQMFAARFVYPVAAATGFMLGGMLGSGKPIDLLFTKPLFPISMVVTVVIFSFSGIWLARKLFQISYKKHIDKLEQHIIELEQQASTEIP